MKFYIDTGLPHNCDIRMGLLQLAYGSLRGGLVAL